MSSLTKICIISNNPFSVGGLQRVTVDIANILCQEYDVDILCLDVEADPTKSVYKLNDRVSVKHEPSIAKEVSANAFIRGLRYVNRKFIGIKDVRFLEGIYLKYTNFNSLVRFINENEYDVVIGLQFRFSVILGYIKKKLNCKCIGWQHNTFEAYFETKASYYWNQHELARKYLVQLDDCILLSNRDVQEYKNRLNISTHSIYDPINMGDDPYVLRNAGAKKNILWVGRLTWEQKGLEHLLDIASGVEAVCPDSKILVIGDGPDRQKLQEEIAAHKIRNIVLCGSTNNVERYYREGYLLISTSNWEGFGLTVVEAMAFGVPVIAFDNFGPHEIIANKNNGVLIEKYQKDEFIKSIQFLIEHEEVRNRMSVFAWNRSREFTGPKVLEAWNKVLL